MQGNLWDDKKCSIASLLNLIKLIHLKWYILETSLVVQWLRLHVPHAGSMGLIPGRGTEILHATLCSQKKKKEVHFSDCKIEKYQNVLTTIRMCAHHK